MNRVVPQPTNPSPSRQRGNPSPTRKRGDPSPTRERGNPSPTRKRGTAARAALLLEVVIAMTILVAAIGLLSAQLVNGINMTSFAEEQLRASQIAERVLALVELDPNVQRDIAEASEEAFVEHPVGDEHPGYFWRVRVAPIEPDDETLFVVTTEVLYQADPERRDTIDGATLVRRLAYLRVPPASLTPEQLGLGAPGGEGGLPGGLPPELAANLPALLSMITGSEGPPSIQGLVASLDPELLQQVMPMLQALMQGGGGQLPIDPSLLEQLGGAIPQLPGGGEIPNLPIPGQPPPPQQQPRSGREPRVPPNSAGGAAPRGPQNGPPRGGPSRAPAAPPVQPRNQGGGAELPAGGGSGEGGSYTIEDLMRLREEMSGGGG